jgi:hypothetical protein
MKKIFLFIALTAFIASFTAPVSSQTTEKKANSVQTDKDAKVKDDKKCEPGCTKPCCKDKKACCSKDSAMNKDCCKHKQHCPKDSAAMKDCAKQKHHCPKDSAAMKNCPKEKKECHKNDSIK